MKRMKNFTLMLLVFLLGCSTYSFAENTGICVLVKATTAPYLYAWTTSGTTVTDLAGKWPGSQLSSTTTTSDGLSWYYYTFDKTVTSLNLILNNGKGGTGNQTANITDVTDTVYYTYDGGSTYTDVTATYSTVDLPSVCTYVDGYNFAYFEAPSTWGTSVNVWPWNDTTKQLATKVWPGDAITSVGTADNGNKIYLYKGSALGTNAPTKIIFNDGTNKTGDLTFTNGGYYTSTGLKGTVKSGVTPTPTPTPDPVTDDYNVMRVWFSDGGTIDFQLSETPKVIVTDNVLDVYVKTADGTSKSTFTTTNVHKYTLEKANVTDINSADNVNNSCAKSGNLIHLQGFKPRSVVEVYTVNGYLVNQYNMDANGNLSIDTSSYQHGIYIIKTTSTSCKFTK